jgi:hypothetical protein
MSMRRVSQLAVILLFLTGCAATPEGTVRSFHRAIERGDADQAIEYLSSGVRSMLPIEKIKEGFREQSASIKACGGIKDIEVSLSGEGDKRKGSSTVTFKGSCPADEENITLVREEGKWKFGLNK